MHPMNYASMKQDRLDPLRQQHNSSEDFSTLNGLVGLVRLSQGITGSYDGFKLSGLNKIKDVTQFLPR